jgi:energy-coupling factor transport system substrate-specific component
VSWQAGVMAMLAVTLLGGFAWYERSRPPSQIVALVAALAAISVAGRVAFSPIPNVVPSTDIALIAGYALGGAPGFAVGALTGLVSNFWLGQGPWTPWQMAGWGLTGVVGAGLAAATGRRVGRVGLAVVCALMGFAYGALLDFSLMVTYGGEQSLHRFLALSARGLPFNIAHAAGNAALALVAGPAMARMLLRYRRRFEFAWKPNLAGVPPRSRGATAGAACLIAAMLIAAPALLGGGRADASGGGSGAAVSWLRGAQNGDGGFGFARGEESSPAMTGWAVLGLEAAGVNPLDVDHGDATPISYLAGTVREISTTGDIERTILLLHGAGLNPRRFQGHDLVSRLLSRRGGDGSWGGQVNPTAFGILALKAAGAPSGNSRSAAWLRANQNDDGGWGFAAKSASDADSTGAVLQALAAAGGGAGKRAGVSYLRGAQRAGGGFALSGGPVNAQSTAWAAQGLVAAGVSPSSVRSGGSPLAYLASAQAPDGHYRYSSSSDQTPVWVTGQALLAVNGAAFPLNPVPRAVSDATRGGGSVSSSTGGASGGLTGGGKAKSSGKAAAVAPGVTQVSRQGNPVSSAPASSTESGDGGGGGVPAWLLALGAVALVGGAVWGGWLLYRRRLPN